MFCLGMPAVAAAIHKHEFSTVYEAIMDQQHGYLHPFQYVHSRLSALAAFTYGSPQDPTLDDTDTASFKNEEAAGPDCQNVDGAQEVDQSAPDFGSITSQHKSIRRTATSYQIAHPPPASKHKQRRKGRSRVLLQLRQISQIKSPVPALDVLPSTLFATRLTRRFPTLLNSHVNLGIDDLVIINSESYDVADKENRVDEESDEEHLANREIIAIISPPGKADPKRQEHAQIWFNRGFTWTAHSIANKGYEFVSLDGHGVKTTARWVQKAPKIKGRPSNIQGSSSLDEERSKMFKFSVLNPDARRHPVIASMDRHAIDVSDQYASLSTPSLTPTPNSPAILSAPSQVAYFSDRPPQPNHVIEIDDELRTLVLVTGIWVAFVEGWSESIKYNVETGHSTSSVNTSSPWRNRIASGQFDNGDDARATTPQSIASIRSCHPTLNVRHHRSTISTSSTPAAKPYITRHRTNSVGTSPVHRMEDFDISFGELGLDLTLQRPLTTNMASPSMEEVHQSRKNSRKKRTFHPQLKQRQSPVLEESLLNPEMLEFTKTETMDDEVERTYRASEDSQPASSITSEAGKASSTSSKPSRKKTGKVSRLLNYINRNKRRDGRHNYTSNTEH